MEREINKKLRNMTKSEIEKICRKMKCPTGTKSEMITVLLQPLRIKYKMDKIPLDLKRKIIGYTTKDSELGALRATSKSQEDLQPMIYKRASQHLNKVKKWNKIFSKDGIKGFERELKKNKFKDIKDVHDLVLKDEIYKLSGMVDSKNLYIDMLRRNLNNINDIVIENYVNYKFNNETLKLAVKEYLRGLEYDANGRVRKYGRSSTHKYGHISEWNVSNVTDMKGMFREAKYFNGDLSKWNVSNVTNMSCMFYGAFKFDGDLSKWNVSNVRDMNSMFDCAKYFEGDLSKWNVSNVTNMNGMFKYAKFFNGDLSKWDVSNVRDMRSMFEHAYKFNGDLSKWDVSNVRNMRSMFEYADSFNGDLSKWDVSNVTDMKEMFYYAEKFNGDLSKWDVSNVTNMYSMFGRFVGRRIGSSGTYWVSSFDKRKNAPWYS